MKKMIIKDLIEDIKTGRFDTVRKYIFIPHPDALKSAAITLTTSMAAFLQQL